MVEIHTTVATEQQYVIDADDLTDADEEIIDVLGHGARTKGAIIDATGLHRNTVGNRLDVLEAGDVIERIHDRTALYDLVDDPREDDDTPTLLGKYDTDDLRELVEAERAEADEYADRVVELESELEDCRDQLADARDGGDLGPVRRGIEAALSALDGHPPDVETAVAELERAREAIGDV
jgi:hypothetical protein